MNSKTITRTKKVKVERTEYLCSVCNNWVWEGDLLICEKCGRIECYCSEDADDWKIGKEQDICPSCAARRSNP